MSPHRVGTKWFQVGILLQIAFRNLFASRLKTFIVGGIILFGTVLVVVGSSLIDTVDAGMRRSIQGSLGGHLQVYDARSKDQLAIYGGMMGDSDLEPIEDYAKLREVLERVPNVKMAVPMGLRDALVSSGNVIDKALERLREDVRRRERGDRSPEVEKSYTAHRDHLERMITVLKKELEGARSIAAEGAMDREDVEALARAASPEFWAGFDRDPLAALEFLENRIAPLALDGSLLYIRYAGTDLDLFPEAFDRFRMVDGDPVPKGQRGILLARFYAEEWLKLKTARRLDKIKEARDVQGKTIAADEALQRFVRENRTQTRDILLQLDPVKAELAAEKLRKALGSSETDLAKLIVELLSTDDRNFDARYAIFYNELAPLLDLYLVHVGDTITIKAPSKSGYMNSVNVKVYGLFEFRGLEKSTFAGFTCLMDILTFRDLYGYLTADRAAEIARIKEQSGARDVSRDEAEAALFGGGGQLVASGTAGGFDDARLFADGGAAGATAADPTARVYTQQEIDGGVALNAAVVLEDPSRLRETMRDIEAATSAAGIPVKAITWQEASGLIGQFVSFARLILWIAVLIIFAVALVIINNAMVMATLQRVKEIGTMRAVGAQRRFVLLMMLVEATAVGLSFGAVGTALGAGIVTLIRARGGIPAGGDELYFFFSGPALLPVLGKTSLLVAIAIVFFVSIASGVYPALMAMRVTPLEAMQSDE